MTQTLLERASEISTTEYNMAGGDVFKLPEAFQTVVVIETVQGIIDNGGLEYFFESDFPNNPPYSFFVDVFRRVGAEGVAHCIEDASRMFPFPDAHLHECKRQRWLESVKHDDAHEFVRLSRRACGDESVFLKLADYVEKNRHVFDGA